MKSSKPTPTAEFSALRIVGVSLPPEVATEFRMEAARRNMRLRALFLEMRAKYKKTP
jgi:hypothetical protein